MSYNEINEQPTWSVGRIVRWVIAGVLLLIALVAAVSSVYTVNEQDRGILLSGGAFTQVVDPGIHVKVPFYQNIKLISTQTWTDSFPKLTAYTSDSQTATLRVSVTWTPVVSKLPELYREALTLNNVTDRFINPQVPTQVENTFGKFTSGEMISERVRFVDTLTDNIRRTVPEYIRITSVQVENIDFTDEWEKAAEARATAEIAITTARHIESKRTVEQRVRVKDAEAEAASNFALAKAEAEAIEVRGLAEAKGIEAKGKALRDNPMLVELAKADKWNGILPTHVVPGNATPFISMGK